MTPRTTPVLLLAGAIVLLFVAGTARQLLRDGVLAEPVAVHVLGFTPREEDKVRVFFRDKEQKLWAIPLVLDTSYWTTRETWVSDLVLKVPGQNLAKLQGVTLLVATQSVAFSGDEVRSWEKKVPTDRPDLYEPGDVLLAFPGVLARTSSLPWVEPVPWNWPGDGEYLQSVWRYTCAPILLIGVLAFLVLRSRSEEGRAWCLRVLGFAENEVSVTNDGRGRLWDWTALLVLGLALVHLEVREPYYFTQDDNIVDCLPMILEGCRRFWEGEFPEYNPYLFLGAPLASLGMYSLTYPPLHLSYAVARHVLQNEAATLEVFAVLHLLAGFWATRMLARRVGMGPLPANLTSLSFVLSGAILIIGRSWFNFLPVVFWLPALFLGLVRLAQGTLSWKWVLGMGLASGLPFHVGFSQVAIYLSAFVCLAVVYLLVTQAVSWRQALPVVPALVIGAGLALPLVYQQWLQSRGVQRFESNDEGIIRGLGALFFPYPLIRADLPTEWGNIHRHFMGHFYFFGGILALLFLLQLVGLVYFRPARRFWPQQVWTVLGFFAFWVSLGSAGGLWKIVSALPVVGFINRYPMRVLPFLVFFAAMAGGLVLERLLRLSSRRRRAEVMVAAAALLLLTMHVFHCHTAFYVYGFEPYPELPTGMADLLQKEDQSTGRIFSWGRVRSSSPTYGLLLAHNIPAAYRLATLEGYNPIVGGKPIVSRMMAQFEQQPEATLRAFGVRWHLLPSPSSDSEPADIRFASWLLEVVTKDDAVWHRLAPKRLPEVYRNRGAGVRITELSPVDPLAFVEGDLKRSLPIVLHGWGIEVDVSELKGNEGVIVNFLRYPEMSAELDGKTVPCHADSWNRIWVTLPARGQRLAIRYSVSWMHGIGAGLLLVLAGLLIFRLSKPSPLAGEGLGGGANRRQPSAATPTPTLG